MFQDIGLYLDIEASFCIGWVSNYKFFVIQVVEVPNVSWEDIGGLENVKRELQEV